MGEDELIDAARRQVFPVDSTYEETDSLDSQGVPQTDDAPAQHGDADQDIMPEKLGRYVVERRLGRGAFGVVYLAEDSELKRLVALKVPRAKHFATEAELDQFIQEARTAAQLQHPGIVTVHDISRQGDRTFIVQQYIQGQDLAAYVKSQPPAPQCTAAIMSSVADAVAFAHQKGFVHRDLKPSNILLDEHGRPHVADFGLAIHESIQRRLRGERSGTAVYMSPEQVRGETHRLDGRSDIWSLGVILYEMLAGRRPFGGESRDELFDEIQHRDPTPPRQLKPELPAELERICLKCLAKRATERYSSAADLAADLRGWLAGDQKQIENLARSVEAKIVPKGLRSFGAEDADFFLDLLPGPRDRTGLPESIRFWKTRIDQTDPNKTFAVGLIYGPSGCGKSSLVKAGLLPRLASHVSPIYVEATAADTEVRLLKGLRAVCGEIPQDASLPDVIQSLREGLWAAPGRKILIVLDQFEQWLHAKRAEPDAQLVQALRHCDGGRVQSVVLVRDDFWLATSRFMQALEVELVEGHNSALVDLFDPLHARRVLAEFGRAFGRLPDKDGQRSMDQETFLDHVVQGLAVDGKVICVRLALFADMIKGKPWGTATLKQVGGTEGLGVTFLEETFSASTSPPRHRLHQKAARQVLRALLPESGTDIKGHMQSYDQLLQASGLTQHKDFEDLIRLLDRDLRLITPTDPEGKEEGRRMKDEGGTKDEQTSHFNAPSFGAGLPTPPETLNSQPSTLNSFYQLTHDYLVPSLREWLTRKQKETRRGRAELRLAERSSLWNAKPQNRQLPAWWEWLNIRLLTEKRKWTHSQTRMMRRATRVHGIRFGFLALIFAALTFTALHINWRIIDASHEQKAAGLVTALLSADIQQVPGIITDMNDVRRWAQPMLEQEFDLYSDQSRERLHISLALLPTDGRQVDYLKQRLLTADPGQVDVIRRLLAGHKDLILEDLWQVVEESSKTQPGQLLPAVGALALYDGDSQRWRAVADRVTNALVNENALRIAVWIDILQPARRHLLGSLGNVLRDRDAAHTQTERDLAANILEKYAADDVGTLAGLILDAQPKAFVANGQSSAAGRKKDSRPLVASIWTRDGRPWQIVYGLTADEIRQRDEQLRTDGFAAVNVAGYIGSVNEQPAELYGGVWASRAGDDDDARIYVGAPYAAHKEVYGAIDKAFASQHSLQQFRGLDGQHKYCGVRLQKKDVDTFTFS